MAVLNKRQQSHKVIFMAAAEVSGRTVDLGKTRVQLCIFDFDKFNMVPLEIKMDNDSMDTVADLVASRQHSAEHRANQFHTVDTTQA